MDSTTLPALIAQFREHYPTASLVTELLAMHDGVYVVRAYVQLGETITASGLSADPQIEQADDRAQARALRSLGLGNPPQSQPIPQATSSMATSPPLSPAFPLESRSTFPEPLQPAMPEPVGVSAPRPRSESWDHPTPPEERSQPLSGLPTPSSGGSRPADLPLGNVDRSDDIAKILVEMRRLGWSKAQGRDHLRRTYGKETRQELTDSELMDFLGFLEAQ
ncbi:MAG: hypothetical protein EA367_16160 [Leptolyngbya sp. DLM2.Bin15]|nr:MAG: hypothetical protein EA367_16160 [Leptolyngbya sp. DLM2.Bin15]